MENKTVVTLSSSNPNIKNNYILLKYKNGLYVEDNDTFHLLIRNLTTLFNDHGPQTQWFLEELLNPTSKGITGSLSRIIIKDHQVAVQPSYTLNEDADDFATEIDRNELIRLAFEWENLVLKCTPFVYICCQNDKYFVSDTLPKGLE